jgi:hypothetical protein
LNLASSLAVFLVEQVTLNRHWCFLTGKQPLSICNVQHCLATCQASIFAGVLCELVDPY